MTNKDPTEKILSPGEARYVAKVKRDEKHKSPVWGVYDRKRGSWPVLIPKIGGVAQELTEEQAVVEASRLEATRT